jgi:hypothetical protein
MGDDRDGEQNMSPPCCIGRSSLPWKGQEAESFFDDLSEQLEAIDLKVVGRDEKGSNR